MGVASEAAETSLTETRQAVDLLHRRVASIDTTQQQLLTQLVLITEAVEEGSRMNTAAAWQLAAIEDKLVKTFECLDRLQRRSSSPEEDDPDPDDCIVTGKSTIETTRAAWVGNTPGASASTHPSSGHGDGLGSPRVGGGSGGAGDGVPGGAGGSRPGGAGAVDWVVQAAVDLEAQEVVELVARAAVDTTWGVRRRNTI